MHSGVVTPGCVGQSRQPRTRALGDPCPPSPEWIPTLILRPFISSAETSAYGTVLRTFAHKLLGITTHRGSRNDSYVLCAANAIRKHSDYITRKRGQPYPVRKGLRHPWYRRFGTVWSSGKESEVRNMILLLVVPVTEQNDQQK